MPLPEGLPRATIVERRDVTPDLMVIKLQTPEPFPFKAGQYITIGLEGIERPYSIVSAPHEPLIELFIELVPEGPLTTRLWRLRVGDQVTYRPRAKGIFTFDPRYTHHLMVATVTGVVPYVSMLRSLLHQGADGYRCYVLQGASYCDEFVYDGELAALVARHPNLVAYVPTVSRPHEPRNARWEGAVGRVNQIVEEWVHRWGLEAVKEQTLVYACGHPG